MERDGDFTIDLHAMSGIDELPPPSYRDPVEWHKHEEWERSMDVPTALAMLKKERTRRERMQKMLSDANAEVAEHQMRIFELQSKEMDRVRLQGLLRVANTDLEQSQLGMMHQKAEYEELLTETLAERNRKKGGTEAEVRLKSLVTMLNADLERSQLGAMKIQGQLSKLTEEHASLLEEVARLKDVAVVKNGLGGLHRGAGPT